MAGDWLKIRNDLDDDPHVLYLLHLLGGPDVDLVIAKLRRLWRHADRHTTDGFLMFNSETTIDELVGLPGFAVALVKVGWLEFRDGGAQIVRFEDHNGDSAKRRALARIRQQNRRARLAGKNQRQRDSVTCHANVAPREEKSREEKTRGRNSPRTPSCSEPVAPAAEPASDTERLPATDDFLKADHPMTGVKPRSGRPQDRGGSPQDRGGRKSPDQAGSVTGAAAPDPAPDQAGAPDSAGDPVVLLFPVVGGKRRGGPAEWPLTATKLAEYVESFPGVDVALEVKMALQWCRDNPTKRKTLRGMPAFLTRWLAKAQNDAGWRQPANRLGRGQAVQGIRRFVEKGGDRDTG